MVALVTFTFILLLAHISCNPTAAHPTSGKLYPEVIPGPGLSNLAELGFTSADLHTMEINSSAASLALRDIAPGCGPDDSDYTDVNDIIACFHYLNNLGETPCQLPGPAGAVLPFCTSGQGQVIGTTLDGAQSSFCSDVASAVLSTINSCTRPDQSVAGFQAANGNGNIIVQSGNSATLASR